MGRFGTGGVKIVDAYSQLLSWKFVPTHTAPPPLLELD